MEIIVKSPREQWVNIIFLSAFLSFEVLHSSPICQNWSNQQRSVELGTRSQRTPDLKSVTPVDTAANGETITAALAIHFCGMESDASSQI